MHANRSRDFIDETFDKVSKEIARLDEVYNSLCQTNIRNSAGFYKYIESNRCLRSHIESLKTLDYLDESQKQKLKTSQMYIKSIQTDILNILHKSPLLYRHMRRKDIQAPIYIEKEMSHAMHYLDDICYYTHKAQKSLQSHIDETQQNLMLAIQKTDPFHQIIDGQIIKKLLWKDMVSLDILGPHIGYSFFLVMAPWMQTTSQHILSMKNDIEHAIASYHEHDTKRYDNIKRSPKQIDQLQKFNTYRSYLDNIEEMLVVGVDSYITKHANSNVVELYNKIFVLIDDCRKTKKRYDILTKPLDINVPKNHAEKQHTGSKNLRSI